MTRFVLITGLLAAVAVFFLAGLPLLAFLSLCFCAGLLWRWVFKVPQPEEELPCSAVSCCHYLDNGDQEKSSVNKD